MEKEETLPVRSETPSTTPVPMMMLAIEKNLDLDKVARAMELQQKWEANEARKAYHDAMAQFKASPPEIDKDRHVKFQTSKGMTEYRHASLANVTAKINAQIASPTPKFPRQVTPTSPPTPKARSQQPAFFTRTTAAASPVISQNSLPMIQPVRD